MTSEELIAGAIVTGCGGIAATLRWAVNRVTKTIENNTDALAKNATESAVQAETNRTMTGKIERLTEWITELLGALAPACEQRPPRDAGDASSRASTSPISRPATQPGGRPRTPAMGAPVVSAGLYGVGARRGADE